VGRKSNVTNPSKTEEMGHRAEGKEQVAGGIADLKFEISKGENGK
jgi:hypothetical protein